MPQEELQRRPTPEEAARQLCFIREERVEKYFDLFFPDCEYTEEEVAEIRRFIAETDSEQRVDAAVDIFGRRGWWDLSEEFRADLRPEIVTDIVDGLHGRGERRHSLGGFLAAMNDYSRQMYGTDGVAFFSDSGGKASE